MGFGEGDSRGSLSTLSEIPSALAQGLPGAGVCIPEMGRQIPASVDTGSVLCYANMILL